MVSPAMSGNERRPPEDSASLKLRRAQHHFDELERIVAEYLASGPYEVDTKRDPNSRRLLYKIAKIHPFPSEIPGVLGDVLHNLRTTLDHLAYRLVYDSTGVAPPTHIYFPIADSEADYRHRRDRQLQGASADAIVAIDEMKPYRGGNDDLWRLHRLDIVDKHRRILLAGMALRSINIGPQMIHQLNEVIAANFDSEASWQVPSMNLFIRPADRMFPLRVGDTIFSDLPDSTPSGRYQFVFELALSDEDTIIGEPIPAVLQPMIEQVKHAIGTLAKFFP